MQRENKWQEILESWIGKDFYSNDHIRHQCQCGKPIVCSDHNDVRLDLIKRIPALLEFIQSEIDTAIAEEREKFIHELIIESPDSKHIIIKHPRANTELVINTNLITKEQ